ncbi:MAG: diadenylate cyclase CdaA [Saprospiraceae bacterium]|nr:diadenylate cyclase CdaA [Saprospiraceae bacterium]
MLIDLSFLSFRFTDAIDIIVVGYLMYQMYRLLRGSVAFNIFVGVLLLYVVWWLVGTLKMDLLSMILGQFVSVGVIIVAIVFQPELRRFLLLLGNQTLKGRLSFLTPTAEKKADNQADIAELFQAIHFLSQSKTGALIILANAMNLDKYLETGVVLDAKITRPLLISIFNKESPLHDGAVVIGNQKILAAGCVLPLSENAQLPPEAGLRHRAAVGMTEVENVVAFVVSEESGRVSMTNQGELILDVQGDVLQALLEEHYK